MPIRGRFFFLLFIGALILVTLLTNWILVSRLNDEDGKEERKGGAKDKRSVPSFPSPSSSCPLPDELAVSAMERMQTEECRQRLREVACRIENGTIHEEFPQSSCPLFDSAQKDVYVGCYGDSKAKRLLTGHSFTWKDDNSREKCALKCARAGYVYYGLEFGVECFCGDSLEGGKRIGEERCEERECPEGKKGEKCGGYESMAVWRTGMSKPLVWQKPSYVEVEEGREYGVRILFLLQLNGRNTGQVRQMLRSVYSPRHHYYIHVDERQKYMLREAHRLSSILPNVRVATRLRSTIWGGASLLPMITDAIEASSDLEWDYLINMSESDEMVLSLRELEAQLESRKGYSFLATHGHSTGRFLEKQGFDYVFMECEKRMWRVAHRPSFPANVGLNGGSDWVILHRSLADYSVSREELAVKMRRLFESVLLPVESFFHSLAVNSRFCTSVMGGNLRITSWNRKQGCRCAWLKKVVDWCGCSPVAFTAETAGKFENAKERALYFGRKFDSVISNDAIRIAHRQSSSLHWDLFHPRANASFVNIFDAEIDSSSPIHASFLRALLPLGKKRKERKDEKGKGGVSELWMYKESDRGEQRMVVVYEDENGAHAERLFNFVDTQEVDEENPNIDAFFLSSLEMGSGIDHKEEIFREYSRFIPIDGSVTLLLEWVEIGESNTTKTSPECRVEWREGGGRKIGSQGIKEYDSIRGRQFVELSLGPVKNITAGEWKATVVGPDSNVLGSVSFAVFSNDDSLSRSTVERFYRLEDECRGEYCREKVWSSLFPDPKSDINGYDSAKGGIY